MNKWRNAMALEGDWHNKVYKMGPWSTLNWDSGGDDKENRSPKKSIRAS